MAISPLQVGTPAASSPPEAGTRTPYLRSRSATRSCPFAVQCANLSIQTSEWLSQLSMVLPARVPSLPTGAPHTAGTEHDRDSRRWFYYPFYHGISGPVTMKRPTRGDGLSSHYDYEQSTIRHIMAKVWSQLVFTNSDLVGRALTRPPRRFSLPRRLRLASLLSFSPKRTRHAFIPPPTVKTVHFESGGSGSSSHPVQRVALPTPE